MNNHTKFNQKEQFPFYKTYIDMDCRKDIYAQNQFINIKNKNKTISRYNKIKQKIISNKLRLYYFVGFIALFKLQPIYDCILNVILDVFFHNKVIHQLTNYSWFFLSAFMTKQPNSIIEQKIESKIVNKTQNNIKLSEIFYKLDKSPYPINIPNCTQNCCQNVQEFIKYFSQQNNLSILNGYLLLKDQQNLKK